jgi:hypothetical protein
MDFLKKGQEMMNGGNQQAAQQQQQQQQGGAGMATGNNQQEDYGDKGLFLSRLEPIVISANANATRTRLHREEDRPHDGTGHKREDHRWRERVVREGHWVRPLFCFVLVCAALAEV